MVLIDRSLEDAEKGKGYSAKLLAKQVERGRMKQDAADAVLARITPATEYDGLKDADFVIEAVFEDRAIKADVTKKTAAVLPAGVPFASNTSTLPITGLAEAWRDETAFIGVHFFSPVDKMQLVEIIRGKKTSDATLAVAMDYVQRIKKTPIVVNDSRGFYTSRVFATYTGEGMRMLAEGINPALIENAGKMTSMPMPPLALSDEVALDLIYKIGKQTAKDMGAAYKPSPIDPMIEKLVVQLGRLGKKAGKGFYDYPGRRQEAPVAGPGRAGAARGRAAAGRRTQEALPLHPGAGDRALLRGERADRAGGRRRRRHPRLGLRAVERRAAVADRHRRAQGVRGGMRSPGPGLRPALCAQRAAAADGREGRDLLRRCLGQEGGVICHPGALSPGSGYQHAPEQAERWIPGTRPGMTLHACRSRHPR